MSSDTASPPPAPPPEPPPATAPQPPRRRRRRRWPGWLAWLLAVVVPLLLVGALLLMLVSAITTATGTARLLAWLPRITVIEPSGPLLGDFSARQILVDLGSNAHPDDRIVLDRPAWRGVSLARSAVPGILARLHIQALSIERVEVVLSPSDTPSPPTPTPTDLALPLQVRVDRLAIGEVQTAGLADPVRSLSARLELGADDGKAHRIDDLALSWGKLTLQGRLAVDTTAPLDTRAEVRLDQAVPPGEGEIAWGAQATASGPLARLNLAATVRAQGQSLDARAVVAPFAAQPVDRLDARLQALDLAAFSNAAPRTALSGSIDAALQGEAGSDLPLGITLTLDNPLADRWDLQRLPVRRLEVQARGLAGRPGDGVTLERLNLALGSAKAPGGTLTGTGRWTPQAWQADLTLDQVQPDRLDQRAPALTLTGPVNLKAAPAEAGIQPLPPLAQWPVAAQAKLDGRVQAGSQQRPASVTLEGRFGPQAGTLARLSATSGEARLEAEGAWTQEPQGRLHLQLKTRWSAFDPALWWPGPAGSPWRTQVHRLTGQVEADLRLPPASPSSTSAPPWWSLLQGQAHLQLDDSRLAGLPLAVDATLQAAGTRAGGVATRGRLALAEQALSWDGRIAPAGSGDAPLGFELQAGALERLAPLLAWWVDKPELAGRIHVRGQIAGLGERPRFQGDVDASGLRWADTRIAALEGRWALALVAREAQSLSLQLKDVQAAGRRFAAARLQLEGSGLDHTLSLEADAPVTPPWQRPAPAPQATGDGAPAAAPAQPARLDLRVKGGVLVERPEATLDGWLGWQGRLERLDLRPVGPSTGREPALPWISTRDVGIQWRRGQSAPPRSPDTPARLSVDEGRARLQAGGHQATVRWSRILWQQATERSPGLLEAQAELEPLAVAPLLRELQPGLGWQGDLQMAARVNLRSSPSFSADVELLRTGGDLQIEEAGLVDRLGLTDLRLALTARDGLWRFTQSLAGSNLGTVRGEQTARTDPQAWWPGSQAALAGSIQADVDNLATWGAWVPAGWRLGGQLQVQARVGGRLGEPEYTGEIRGRAITARNLLAGVHVQDGEVHITLQGATARIETLKVRAGEGSASVTGGASLGAQPRAELKLVAERFALLSRVDRRVTVSGTAQLSLEADAVRADGSFKVDEGLYDISRSDAPSLSDDVVVRRAGDAPAAPGAANGQPAPRRNLALNLSLDMGERFRLKGRGLNTRLAGGVKLTTPGGRMTVVGDIRAVDGTYDAYGQKLTIDRGVISFVGVPDNPRLDIEATRPNTDIRVGVAIGGTAQSPRVRLFSEPDMSDTDKLSWLVLGRASGQLGRAESALLQRAVLALLAGEGESPTSGLTSALGLDQLSIRQAESGGVSETIVSLGRQISQRWYVGYERSLNATAGSWQLIYRVAQRFTVRAQAGEDNSVDLIWTWRW